ncbi:MAG: hypothetical protein H7Z14_04405 [Anaerolineae bacterium]|nr:hypothetical protein [Phycisphaerae bacterium]
MADPKRRESKKDSTSHQPLPTGGQIAGSMHTEEPMGWDQAPNDIKDPEHKRHPRPDGAGGLEPPKIRKKR